MKLLKHYFNPLGIKKRFEKNINHLAHPRKTWRKIRKLRGRDWLKLLGKGTAVFLFILIILFIWYSKDLPALSRLKALKAAESTQILDRNGGLLYAISGEKQRMIIPGDQIPEYVKQATVAIEDEDFYRHYGLDFKGVLRAAYLNATGKSRYTQGGSTITQQYVKNALLTTKKTFSRKIRELILSVELEIIYPKDKILEMYLNEIPYGSTSYGIEAASHRYFNKKASELNLEQAAALAALPQAPTYYSPYGPHKDALLARKNLVLDKMAKNGYISSEQAQETKNKKIEFSPPSESLIAPHFVFYIRQYLVDKYGEKMVEEGGLKVTTTLDVETQKKAIEAIKSGEEKLNRYKANNAALVAIDPKNGQILAMVGSRDYFNDEIDGQVNVATSARQPGSSFKPIVYATAFKEKYNPAFTLFDLTTDFGNYTPDNYNGIKNGPVTMRFALANSLNIPAVRTLALAGLNNALKTASDLGITTLTEPDRYGLSLVLGGGEVKPLEMAGAFGVFANSGKKAPLTGILKIENSTKILEEFQEDKLKITEALDPQIAYQINHILSDRNARTAIFGERNYLNVAGQTVAAKTGTTQEFHDAWTVGYTPQISVAVWAGNTDNSAMRGGADGSVLAAPIWNKFISSWLNGKKDIGFDRPAGIREIAVDKMSNKLPTDDSPDVISDIFTSWQAPDQPDDIHVRVNVNKLNGKLATEFTPKELVESRLYTDIHSEQPDKPNWEGPVAAWAREKGIDNRPPTEKDDMYASLDQAPVVQITTPIQGTTLSGETVFRVGAGAHFGVKQIVFAIDGVEIGRDDSLPYEYTYNVSNLSEGEHTLTVFGFDQNGASSNAKTTFKIAKDGSGPIISNISVVATGTSAIVSFTTDEPSVGYVKYGLSNANLNARSVSDPEAYTSHSITLANLTSTTLHYFQIVSQDSFGNSASSSIYSFSTK